MFIVYPSEMKNAFFTLSFILFSGLLFGQNQRIEVLLSQDVGFGSLRTAINSANPHDTIAFGALTDGFPLVLDIGRIDINKPLIILGNGKNTTTITSNGTSSLFYIVNTDSVEFINLTLRNGAVSSSGGAILAENASLVLNNVQVDSCTANVSNLNDGGGAIYLKYSDLSTYNASEFASNVTTSNGGAIFVDANSSINLIGSSFSNNSAAKRGGAIHFASTLPSTQIIQGVAFNQNTSSSTNFGGGAISIASGKLAIDSCAFNGNGAQGGTSSGGGAILNSFGTLSITNQCSFLGNSVNSGSANGGAILSFTPLFIESASFQQNTSNNNGGAVAIQVSANDTTYLNNCVFENNSSGSTTKGGGALFTNSLSVLVIQSTAFDSNRAIAGGAWYQDGGEGYLYNVNFNANQADSLGGALVSKNGILKSIINVNFTDNTADSLGSKGGALYASQSELQLNSISFLNNSSENIGGAIFVEDAARLFLSVAVLENNAVVNQLGQGGAIGAKNTADLEINLADFIGNSGNKGGAIALKAAEIQIEKSNFVNNIATGSQSSGGAIYAEASHIETSNISVFQNNESTGLAGTGGAIYSDSSSTFKLVNTQITGNTCSEMGGGIFAANNQGGNLDISDVELNQNTCQSDSSLGGGLFLSGDAILSISGSDVNGNQAGLSGGGIRLTNINFSIENTTISGNSSSQNANPNGGGISLINSFGLISDSSKISNNSSKRGGGIFVDELSNVLIENSELKNNNATQDGGAIYIQNSANKTLTIQNSTLSNNMAAQRGGGIFSLKGNTLILSESTLAKNESGIMGGGIYADSSTVLIQKSQLDSNFTTAIGSMGGGALYAYNSATLISDSSEINRNFNTGSSANGGALFIQGGALALRESKFNNNSTSNFGGAVFLTNSNDAQNQLALISMSKNSSSFKGGAIYIDSTSSTTIQDSRFSNNWTTEAGGAIALYRGTLAISNSVLDSNQTLASPSELIGGGALSAHKGVCSINGTSFIANAVNGSLASGGAINNYRSNINVSNSTFAYNQAQKRGGAIKSEGEININHATIVENEADQGGGISQNLVDDRSYISNSIIAQNEASAEANSDIFLLIGNVESEGNNIFGISNGIDI
ncbi:MAG: putative outer membrane repeat protein, partial [Luteibaculaceae bacterium]